MPDTIKQTYLIAAPREDVWQALTDPAVIRKWSGADCEFPVAVVAPYSLWDGEIVGRVLEMEPPRWLVQTWQPSDWTRADSAVSFTLTAVGKGTRVDLVHVNVEEWDYDGTSEGWDIYYVGAIKKLLEARNTKSVRNTKAAKGTKTAKKAKTAALKKKTTTAKSARQPKRKRSV
ncbi:MAG: SRPBCC domain-containing protein [Chloroflexi bacterium]|nr:SRPBCC domain-containing protein [Chloroflexota bacterium]